MGISLAVVLVGYNRPESLKRLYKSVLNARTDKNVDLIISIDKSDVQDAVASVIDADLWDKGKVVFKLCPERLGLRKHILACGDLTEVYDAVVVFEDDIVASDSFIDYVFSSVDFLDGDDSVGGISLYSPLINEMSSLPFTPKKNGFDNYYLQSAQSWGQCWTRKMWKDFRDWYDINSSSLKTANDMPSRIYSWPETSWKKYYMKYLVEKDKTFFYPYDSFSTNYSDVGQHNKTVSPHYQVPLVTGKRNFHFGTMGECFKYDVFFERIGLKFNNQPLCLDLYGTKCQSSERYFLTAKKLPVAIVGTFGLTYRPQEDNYIFQSKGADIFLYDLSKSQDLIIKEKYVGFKLANYHTNLTWENSLIYALKTFKLKVIKKLRG